MDNMIALIEALNVVSGNVDLRDGDVIYRETNEKGEVVERYVIKLRPVADENGVEEFKFVARKQK